MEKIQTYRHKVTGNGKLDVRIATEYINNDGKIEFETMSPSVTPEDINNMDGWDDRSKEIIATIIEKQVLFEEEKNELIVKGKAYIHPSKITGIGVEETCAHESEIMSNGIIKGRYTFMLFDDGELIKKSYLGHDRIPGIKPNVYGGVLFKAVATKLHTPEVVSRYKLLQALAAELEATG